MSKDKNINSGDFILRENNTILSFVNAEGLLIDFYLPSPHVSEYLAVKGIPTIESLLMDTQRKLSPEESLCLPIGNIVDLFNLAINRDKT